MHSAPTKSRNTKKSCTSKKSTTRKASHAAGRTAKSDVKAHPIQSRVRTAQSTSPQFTIEVLPDANAVAVYGAAFIADWAQKTLSTHKTFTLAASGGKTPWQMFALLAKEALPWQKIHLFQVDERILPAGDRERNFTHLRKVLATAAALQFHPMPVEAPDLEEACTAYTRELQRVASARATLDLIHLGLGEDGHTASLFPGDLLLDEKRRKVGLTHTRVAPQRMTLTLPVLNRAKQILWVVTGKQKSVALQKLLNGDPSIPASRVQCKRIFILADEDAASFLSI